MLASMTGFGEAHQQLDAIAVAIEMRTINNRHLKLSLRANEGYSVLEPEIDRLVRTKIRRGTVQMNLRVTRVSSEDDYQINGEVLKGYTRQLSDFGLWTPAPTPELLAGLLSLPGVVADRQQVTNDAKADWSKIEPVISEALDKLVAMRETEGQALEADLLTNCEIIAGELAGVIERAPSVGHAYRDRLTERVNAALEELNVSVEPADLIREVAVFADRTDISEETVRLKHHVEQFTETVKLPESSGRKLDFITQEMVREVNTIGSKANDAEISRRVVEMKTALERIREQVQNVE